MALYQREKKRTVSQINAEMIDPRCKRLIEGAVQYMGHFCRKNHIWQNHTGALENSLSWSDRAERTPRGWRAHVEAGGFSITKWTFDHSQMLASGKRIPNKIGGVIVPAGTPITVTYARHVERKGYPVLKQGIEPTNRKFRSLGVRIMKLPDSPRI